MNTHFVILDFYDYNPDLRVFCFNKHHAQCLGSAVKLPCKIT